MSNSDEIDLDSLLGKINDFFRSIVVTFFNSINYVFKNEVTGNVYAEGSTRMVLFNEDAGRPILIPDWFTKKYLK